MQRPGWGHEERCGDRDTVALRPHPEGGGAPPPGQRKGRVSEAPRCHQHTRPQGPFPWVTTQVTDGTPVQSTLRSSALSTSHTETHMPQSMVQVKVVCAQSDVPVIVPVLVMPGLGTQR